MLATISLGLLEEYPIHKDEVSICIARAIMLLIHRTNYTCQWLWPQALIWIAVEQEDWASWIYTCREGDSGDGDSGDGDSSDVWINIMVSHIVNMGYLAKSVSTEQEETQ